MELVPDEELEASSRGSSGAPADRRALKVDTAPVSFVYNLTRTKLKCFGF